MVSFSIAISSALLFVCHAIPTAFCDPPAIDALNSTRESYGDAWVDPNNPITKLFGGDRIDLWSLRKPERPEVPVIENDDWSYNSIDTFFVHSWRNAKLQPTESASDRELIQRLFLDLNGLPPTEGDVCDFSESLKSVPGAYDDIVNRLLASPRFGEHWARMWLDVVRYSDSNGFDWDEFRPNAWRYRDYVIDAWNSDKPYSTFVIEQLAGDETFCLPPQDQSQQNALVATGYLRLGPQDNAAKLFNEQDRARAELLSDLTETTAAAFLGQTFSCCRCHDHKTDPLSQEDHYRFRAFFAATTFADDVSIDLAAKQSESQAFNQTIDEKIELLNARLKSMVDEPKPSEADAEADPPAESSSPATPSKRKKGKKAKGDPKAGLSAEVRLAYEQIEKEIAELNQSKRQPTLGLLMTDNKDDINTIHVFQQGDHRSPKQSVEAGFPSVFRSTPVSLASCNSETTGRRLALAHWIIHPDNPWTARVIVNRIWMQLFEQGLVETANDFGVTGVRPSNQALLDYLASELISHDWSLKHVIRLIVSSHAYQQRAISQQEGTLAASQFASSRTALRRKSAEQLRDSILAVTGVLQNRNGGKPIWPKLSDDVLSANPAVLDDNETKTKGWYPSPEHEQSVRSIYLVQKRTLRIPWLETFDLPENTTSCPRRENSIVAPQALTLMNGEMTLNAAKSLAERIEASSAESIENKVNSAYLAIHQRKPHDSELVMCESFLNGRSLAELVLVLLNSNEFFFMP